MLIIEDEHRLAGLIKAQLGAAGFAVDVVYTVAEGTAALELINYDAAVLDLGLPDGDGLSFLRSAWFRGRRERVWLLLGGVCGRRGSGWA